jgi:hypothetical protein
VATGAGPPLLDLRVEATAVDGFAGAFDPKAMRAEIGAARARYVMVEGEVAVDGEGRGVLELSVAEGTRSYFALVNLVRAALAWRMLSRGGALLHAAGIVLDGRAFVLVGRAGSGKSTWARLAAGAGATVLSDDLVMLDRAGTAVEALGAPFRSTHRETAGPGRWPLGAVLFPARGGEAALGPVRALETRARVLANLPFVAEGIEEDPRVDDVVETLVTAVPARVLTFPPDASFVETLRSMP